MSPFNLEQAVEGLTSLRGVFLTVMPDCLLYDSFARDDTDWVAEEVASYFGDLVRANRQGLKALQSWSSEMNVTIESSDLLLILKEIRDGNFVIGFAFDRKTPLGMVRLHTRQVVDRIEATLPKFEAEERARGARVIEFLEKYAPDPHAARQRVSLRSGVAPETLQSPEALAGDDLERVEKAVLDILGLESLNL